MTSATDLLTRLAHLEGQVDSGEKIDALFLKVHDEIIVPASVAIKSISETQEKTAEILRELRDTQIVCRTERATEQKAIRTSRDQAKHVGMVVTVSVLVLTTVGAFFIWGWDHIHLVK